ncbi:MAG: Diaminohydroxyphosphoribosylaminopyrimidine deaminase (EC / 5-amino-6-(5-phosphoribosylamino)uracil reductase (EC [uncultured Campylobacterales bacterium]|uniref:Riboflavin biosynthesis protein RibD n=1 Tax=uncultured Campylobacterales bacterium TaxID=352960 RepID=A0A6S6ST68_9BACT|nr:MAG: Diaminohydroxyphosphoribosylaminopyrimidine deaminase (EC / 5-amino-6-(5-phosphoribosylamino)uracil reductase (EC [uncultured Campylobacterales bacterium]
MNYEFYMNLAINKAWEYQGLTYPNPAVGSVVVNSNGKILSCEAHKASGYSHSELESIKVAYEQVTGVVLNDLTPTQLHNYLIDNHKDIFEGACIYVTLEPCNHFGKTPACSNLIHQLKFAKVVIGSLDDNKIASGGKEYLISKNVEVKTGILKARTDELLYPFKKWQEDRFVFFKLAQNINGNCTINKNISSNESKLLVHKLRSKIDLLVIGGNTVRRDKPALDTRLLKNSTHNPDVLILSNEKKFDTTNIPLFSVPNRKVYIANNLKLLDNYNFIMIEGTKGMLKACKDIVDMNLTFLNTDYSSVGENINIDLEQKLIYSYTNEDNIITWSK